MEEVSISTKQIIGLVKERNRLHSAVINVYEELMINEQDQLDIQYLITELENAIRNSSST